MPDARIRLKSGLQSISAAKSSWPLSCLKRLKTPRTIRGLLGFCIRWLIFLSHVGDGPLTRFRQKVYGLCQQNDVEGLGTLCKVLNAQEMVIDVVSLHVNLSEIIARILAFVEDFDCEPVGEHMLGAE